MHVSPDWHQEQPLPGTLGMLQDIYILLLQDHLGNFLKRDSSIGLELVALVFIPDEGHYGMNDILYTMSNVPPRGKGYPFPSWGIKPPFVQ